MNPSQLPAVEPVLTAPRRVPETPPPPRVVSPPEPANSLRTESESEQDEAAVCSFRAWVAGCEGYCSIF
ncbi:hypothetical protein [Hymenobacter sp. BT491]|uniref:hypothetical protein n=1 Tax=Hymenobacter sp. BT491 TaxID=2766779 RepID=UPI0016538EC6|nr:hypothetical protein [Hymenobacter sp. BT491]MBC6989914.1 hypothetical protein [Hymenobacter sp. BT491]